MSPTARDEVRLQWLGVADIELARATFTMMCEVFGSDDEGGVLSDGYLGGLLADPSFWALAAIDIRGDPVGGVTAHMLPMTRSESRELFIYDLAVRPDMQRRGIARRLIAQVVERAEQHGLVAVFVPADNDDAHALAFYEAIGGRAAPVTMFDLGHDSG